MKTRKLDRQLFCGAVKVGKDAPWVVESLMDTRSRELRWLRELERRDADFGKEGVDLAWEEMSIGAEK